MSEILCEIQDSNEQERSSYGTLNIERNTEFLNKEISFLLDNLRRVSIKDKEHV
jgi:hypothetical protein